MGTMNEAPGSGVAGPRKSEDLDQVQLDGWTALFFFLRLLQTSDSKYAPSLVSVGLSPPVPSGGSQGQKAVPLVALITSLLFHTRSCPAYRKAAMLLIGLLESLLGKGAGGGGRVEEDEIESEEEAGRVLAPRERASAKERRWDAGEV